MKKERAGTKIITRIKNDRVFREFIFSAFSFFVTLIFAIYNLALGIIYESVGNVGISIYYALFLCIIAFVILSERKFHKANLTDEEKENKRKNLYLLQSIFLFIIDIALIAPISAMVLQDRVAHYSEIPAIATAAYTTYKIIVSTRNVIKTRKERHLSLKILQTVNFVDALVSVLSLQYTLIMTFGDGMNEDMFVLCAVSSFGIWLILIVLSLITLLQSIKLRKKTA